VGKSDRKRALHGLFVRYNFVPIHRTLRVSPAMAAGVTETLWSLEEIVRIINEREIVQKIWSCLIMRKQRPNKRY